MQRPSAAKTMLLFLLTVVFCSCSAGAVQNSQQQASAPLRSSEPMVKVPTAPGEKLASCSVARIDYSNTDQGYITANYFGSKKTKLQITTPSQITYTYTLNGGEEVFALTEGDGNYTVTVNENISGKNYSVVLSVNISVKQENEYIAFLYPNQYVMFTPETKCIATAQSLAADCTDELGVVEKVYNYVMKTIDYDNDRAENVQSGYTPNVDEVIAQKKGICFDYAAVMATMLRTQGIPTKMDVGYAGTIYHAWLSVYIEEIGWVNGIIEFDGTTWKLMDPTFADSSNQSKDIMKFIGDGTNYVTKYQY